MNADRDRESWFVAFPVDGSFLEPLAAVPPGFRLFHRDDVHLTLAFLGACGEARARDALGALDAQLATRAIEPITVSLGEVVPMGNPRAYSALSALLANGRDTVEAWMGRLRDPLADAAGASRETRAPKAHVTIARPARRASDADRRAGGAWAASLALGELRVHLTRIALYTRADPGDERRYRIVEERRLEP